MEIRTFLGKPERHPLRRATVTCLILHGTGGIDLDKTLRYYRDNDGGVTPHYLLDRTGIAWQLVDSTRVAYHVGLSTEQVKWYRAPNREWLRRLKDGTLLDQPYSGYSQWVERWTDKVSPLDLPSGEHPNGNSIGIELLSEGGECSDEQYLALSDLVSTIADDQRLVIDPNNLLDHYSANPIARCDRHGSTDLGPGFDWVRLWTSLK